MAVNQPLNAGRPVLCRNEAVILELTDAQITLENGFSSNPGWGGNYYTSGELILTNYRLIVVSKRPTARLSAVSVLLAQVSEEAYKTPMLFGMLGDHSVEGTVLPREGGGLALEPHNFQICFKKTERTHSPSEKTEELAMAFFAALTKIREIPPTEDLQWLADHLAPGNHGSGTVFVDPAAPSTLFVSHR